MVKNHTNRDEIIDVAMKLDEIYKKEPEGYYFIKGYIHCLSQKNMSANIDKNMTESDLQE